MISWNHPNLSLISGGMYIILSVILLYRIGSGPTGFGLLLGVPFGMAIYASMYTAMWPETFGQKVSPFGVVILLIIGLTFYKLTTGSAGITMGLTNVILGAIDHFQRN